MDSCLFCQVFGPIRELGGASENGWRVRGEGVIEAGESEGGSQQHFGLPMPSLTLYYGLTLTLTPYAEHNTLSMTHESLTQPINQYIRVIITRRSISHLTSHSHFTMTYLIRSLKIPTRCIRGMKFRAL